MPRTNTILCLILLSGSICFGQSYDDAMGDRWHVEAGFTGRLAHNGIAAGRQADAAIMVSGQGPFFDSPFHIDAALSATIAAPTDLGNGWEQSFTLFALSAGLGETWQFGDSWYYTLGGGLGLHVGDLSDRAYVGNVPEQHETATFMGAYIRGNLMYRVYSSWENPIFIGLGAIGQGTTTTHLLGARLSDTGVSVGLFVGVGL